MEIKLDKNSWACYVEKVSNGYILTRHECKGEDEGIFPKEVFEETDEINSEIKAFEYLVLTMMDIFALYGYTVKFESMNKEGE